MRFSVKCAVLAKLVIEVTSTCEDVASKSALTRAASRRAGQSWRATPKTATTASAVNRGLVHAGSASKPIIARKLALTGRYVEANPAPCATGAINLGASAAARGCHSDTTGAIALPDRKIVASNSASISSTDK